MNEKLNKALEEISDKHLEEASKPAKQKSHYWFGAVAAVLVLAILAGALTQSPTQPDVTNPSVLQDPTNPTKHTDPTQGADPTDPTGSTDPTDPTNSTDPTIPSQLYLLSAPVYPEMVKISDNNYQQWQESRDAQYTQPEGYADGLQSFFTASIQQFLQGEGNQAYSPVNVYMALAMLAECTNGTSRQQILDLLGANSLESLRQQASYVWNAHFCDDGLTTTLLANSLWLDEAYSFRQNTVDILADNYYASSFRGDLGTEEMNQVLRQWLNENTGNLLQEQVQDIKLDPSSAAVLASTIFFSAKWEDEFSTYKTAEGIFHGITGNQTVLFMNQTYLHKDYYRGSDFGAVALEMTGNNTMWLILPDADSSTEALLESGAFLSLVQDPANWKNVGTYDVCLSMPKFDIADKTDLVSGMRQLGLTAIFDPQAADLSGLISDANAYIGQMDHTVRVAVEEDGCIAAAYTILEAPGFAPPEDLEDVYFTLDRPFLFLITSQDGLPLFAGTVSQP